MNFAAKNNLTQTKLLNLMTLFSLFMSFNNIIIGGFNISIFIFVYFILLSFVKYPIFNINALPHWAAFFFSIGAAISVYDLNVTADDAFSRSIIVLPNFIYWSLMVIAISNISPIIGLLQPIFLKKIAKFLTIGLFITVCFWEFKALFNLPIFKINTPNSYAFVLVCYSAIGMVYLRSRYNQFVMLVGLIIILLSMLFLERRAGFVLVALSSFFALKFDEIDLKSILSIFIFSIFGFLVLQLEIVENGLKVSSERIYELIYESENIKTEDQSYLTRQAMIEKGLIIFGEHPLTGIGLNNFTNYYVEIPGTFAGSELVLNKELNDKSGHNSYIALLADGGLFVIIPFLILVIYNLYSFVKDLKKRTKMESAFYWSFIAMCIHIYFISEIYNVFAWFIIAIVTSISLKYKRLNYIDNKV
jgi:hypothetical protein